MKNIKLFPIKVLFLLILGGLSFNYNFAYSQIELDDFQKTAIHSMLDAFKDGDKDYIAESLVRYPLKRSYPIPNINNASEMIVRFNEVFDKNLTEKIINSEIGQWTIVGWRGIMLDNGIVWLNEETGQITAVNHESNYEKQLREKLVIKEKDNLHSSLKEYKAPLYKIVTDNYLIRIDLLGNNLYRYASWKVDHSTKYALWDTGRIMATKPDIILKQRDAQETSGTLRTIYLAFKSGNYTYTITEPMVRGDYSDKEYYRNVVLEVNDGKNIVLTEGGNLF